MAPMAAMAGKPPWPRIEAGDFQSLLQYDQLHVEMAAGRVLHGALDGKSDAGGGAVGGSMSPTKKIQMEVFMDQNG